MKTRFLNKMAGLLAVLLLFSCTGKFEEYNTDNTAPSQLLFGKLMFPSFF